ncbi:MAG TPA: flagellar biosynthesis protein FlgE [Gammaproteobacteria bacterium]|jgi:flagellar hook-basal body protein|nr:MAG: flagellar hook-basal body complex protein [OM182 bacterium]HAL40945.1 flagellar biosynthesis protein FlgE [Gammaproteobacteria bacterium]|tara:strand:- start:8165 stop:10957 length:2793 start_codon:yes stop_codon:yes gene_type:complete
MSFYTSLTGLKAATTELALTSNNIANVGTSGFKKSRASFGDIFATSPLQKSTSVVGQGVSLKEVRQEFSQGNVEFSSNTLDLAISGEGFFPLKSADGLTDIFTRNGSFVLNEQFNVVNSSGQALLAAAVDSSGKADLEKLSRLAIPVSTSGQALETSQIELALNLPSDAEVITAPFNRNNPDTYNKSTALSVYDAGGNSYLATIYYVKTANATANSPSNKYQTYVFVGDDQVNPALQQVTDDNLEEVYVNKYGVLKPFSEVEDLLVNRKTQKFALDDLTDVRTSVPATVVGSKLPNDLTADQGFNFSTSAYTAADLRNFMTVDIDDSGNPVTVDLSSFKSENRNITGVELAQFIQNQLNVKFGDDRYFDLTTTSSQTFTVNYADTSGTTTVDVDLGTTFNTEQLQRTATVDAVVEDIQSQIDATLTNGEVTVSYDFASRTFRFMPSSSSDTVSLSSASTNNLFKTTPTPSAVDSDGLYGETITPNGELIRAASEQRFGMGVSYDGAQQTFSFSSGTTGDTSQIALNFSVPEYDTTSGDQLLDNDGNLTGTLTAQVDFATFMGFEVTGTTDSQYSELPSDEAIRGVVSLPAITRGSSIAVNVNNNFSVDASNNTFVVSVNDVKGTLVLPTSSGYTLDSFIIELEKGINQLASDSGSTVSGVTVEYDPDSNGLVFTTGTTGTDSFIKVSGSATWGMANIESGRGTTTTWIKPRQSADIVNNVAVNKYIDEFGNETASADGFSTLPEWSPIFLDKGELTFDTSGNLVSPTGGAQLDTVFLAGGRGALNLNIDYTGTTQFSQAFAVKSQSQDGSPEGDLVGVDIGDDGLVVASYSNGSQESLGKIVLVTFPSNEGLRQNGDSSYLSSAKSGAATFGEAGTAGFGTIRAGARERSNVDLTTELVGLITAQRNFQANAKAIETSSALTSAIINIRS